MKFSRDFFVWMCINIPFPHFGFGSKFKDDSLFFPFVANNSSLKLKTLVLSFCYFCSFEFLVFYQFPIQKQLNKTIKQPGSIFSSFSYRHGFSRICISNFGPSFTNLCLMGITSEFNSLLKLGLNYKIQIQQLD